MASDLAYSFCILASSRSSIFFKISSSVKFARLRAFSLSCCKTCSVTLITYYNKHKAFGTTIRATSHAYKTNGHDVNNFKSERNQSLQSSNVFIYSYLIVTRRHKS
jgi:hypothetical protein